MTINSASTFTCDRDGTVSEPVVVAGSMMANPPEGWVHMSWFGMPVGGTTLKTGALHLCPACADALVVFLNAQEPMP